MPTGAGDPLVFTMLGEVGAERRGTPIGVGPPQRRAVLAALLVDAGRTVTTETLIHRVWGEEPPDGARSALYAHVARLRRTLWPAGPAQLLRRVTGYVLHVDRCRVDLLRFHDLSRRARAPGVDVPEQMVLLQAALHTWRGAPLSGIAGAWADAVRVTWNNQRLDVVTRWSQLASASGDHQAITEVLPAYLGDFPLSEQLMAALIRALHARGRAAEAVAAFAAFRRRLADELGVDPGTELRELHAAVLRVDDGSPAAGTWPVAPAQLPPGVRHLAGRAEELAELDAAAGQAKGREVPSVVAVVSGTAGVGKTTLSVHWAHRVRTRFPGGQLYLDLHGFGPEPPMDAGEALGVFLQAFGVPPGRLPHGTDARTALYRSLLADRRVLVVLDNARDAEHVRPLLPSSPGSLALITSRDRFTPLGITGTMRSIVLAVLSGEDSVRMLADRLGGDRVAAEPDAVTRIVSACAGLPLALAVAAARIQESGFPLAVVADELTGDGAPLDVLDAGDTASRVRAVFSWSYRSLRPEAQRLFRLLGLHPGPDVSLPAASWLAGRDGRETRALLRELVRSTLLIEHAPGRYACHALLRAYAAELTGQEDAAADRHAALERLFDGYAALAYRAARQLDPEKCEMPSSLEPAGRPLPGTPETWISAELPVVLAALQLAADQGFDRQAWQLAWSLNTPLHRCGRWPDLMTAGRTAIAAATRLGDRPAQAHAHLIAADGATLQSRLAEATAHCRTALALYTTLGATKSRADVYLQFAVIRGYQRNHRAALRQAYRALSLYRQVGSDRGRARALNAIGWFEAQLGRFGTGAAACREALSLYRGTRDAEGEAATLDSLGYAQHHLGDHAGARTSLEAAIVLSRRLGDRYLEAGALVRLGDTHRALGEPDASATVWAEALNILLQLGHEDAAVVREKIESLGVRRAAVAN